MDIIRQYITQCISHASNNLRLSSDNIEVIALLRQLIIEIDDIFPLIQQMKKLTALSRLAIRFQELFNFLSTNQIDFARISTTFREHSDLIHKDLKFFLEHTSSSSFLALSDSLKVADASNEIDSLPSGHPKIILDTSLNHSDSINEPHHSEKTTTEKSFTGNMSATSVINNDPIDSEVIFPHYSSDFLLYIKPMNEFLDLMVSQEYNNSELLRFANVMQQNAELSTKSGTTIVSDMHIILERALRLLYTGALQPSPDSIESMKSCLVVIAAVVQRKEIDVSKFLLRAEQFGKKILNQRNYR